MFKRKTWTEVSRRYTESSYEFEGSPSARGSAASRLLDLYEAMMFGVTTVEMRCDQTGEIKFVTTIGKHLNEE